MRRGQKARRKEERSLKLETLEDRTLLSTYTIYELSPEGGRRSYGYAISNTGHTTGESQILGNRFLKASLWDGATPPDRYWTGVIGDNKFSIGKGINSTNVVAGASNYQTNPSFYHAFKYDGTMTDLGALSGNSYGEGINDSGHVVGYSNYTGGAADKYHAVRWDGTQDDIHPVSWGGDFSVAYDINNSGVVAGAANGSSFMSYPHPFVYNPGSGVYTPIPFIPEHEDGGETFAVNNNGHAVGGTYFVGGIHQQKIWRAFYWNGSTTTDLGDLGLGGKWAQGLDINDNGVAVGIANTTFGDSERHAWVWTGSGTIQDLNSLVTNGTGWVLNSADGINNNGWITGWGVRNGQPRGFLLVPNPSPAPPAGIVIDPVTAGDVGGPTTRSNTISVTPAVSVERTLQRVAPTSSGAENVDAGQTRGTVSTAQTILVLPGAAATPEMLSHEMDPFA